MRDSFVRGEIFAFTYGSAQRYAADATSIMRGNGISRSVYMQAGWHYTGLVDGRTDIAL
jgi:hypothetical protein